jgi:CheY-like chemotaxis protein
MEQLQTLNTTTIDLEKWFSRQKPVNVLLIGNNPIDLSSVYTQLISIKNKQKRFAAITAFSLEDSLKRLFQYKPHCILIDDTFSAPNIKIFMRLLGRQKNKKLKNIPVALLKSSNRQDLPSNGIQDFLLKSTLTPDSLSKAILKAMNMRKPYSTFYTTYRYSRRKFHRLVS